MIILFIADYKCFSKSIKTDIISAQHKNERYGIQQNQFKNEWEGIKARF